MATTNKRSLVVAEIQTLGQQRYKKLSPGPGRSASEVGANQRARIQSAMIEIVGEEGYDAVTVRRLAKLAGVSTRTFYEHFEGKEECFLRTYELVVQRTAARVVSSQRGETDWRKRLALAFEALTEEIVSKPRAARLALHEVFAAGPAAFDALERAEDLFEGVLVECFAGSPSAVEVPKPLARALVAGMSFVARERMTVVDRNEALELAQELLEWVLAFDVECADEFGHPDWHAASSSFGVKASNGDAYGPAGTAGQEDRSMIMAAAVKLAAVDGYCQLTVPRILSAAGLRRRSFTRHFNGVEDCFLTALEQWTSCAFEQAISSARSSSSSTIGIQHAIQNLCTRVAADPKVAKLIIVEPRAVGPNGIRRQGEVLSRLALELFHGDSAFTSRTRAEASIGAIWSFLFRCVASDRAQQLPALAPTLSFLALAPVIGGNAAAESIHRAGGRTSELLPLSA